MSWSAIIVSPNFSARGIDPSWRLLHGDLEILVLKHLSHFRSFGKCKNNSVSVIFIPLPLLKNLPNLSLLLQKFKRAHVSPASRDSPIKNALRWIVRFHPVLGLWQAVSRCRFLRVCQQWFPGCRFVTSICHWIWWCWSRFFGMGQLFLWFRCGGRSSCCRKMLTVLVQHEVRNCPSCKTCYSHFWSIVAVDR